MSVDKEHKQLQNLSDENFSAQRDTCTNGIEGIDGNGVVCCPLGCGRCAGEGCTAFGSENGLAADSCCGNAIKASGRLCSETGSAPCIIDEEGPSPTPSFSGGQYGEEYSGEGTYYGHTTAGMCSFFDDVPEMYDGMIPVALNAEQYGDSLMCGACVEGTASGSGSGNNPIPSTFKAFITDKCPECQKGDLDFSMSGDGRWDIEWKFVACPGEETSFVSPSANPYYWKVQPRGTTTPVVSLTVDGQSAMRTTDNHFEVHNDGAAWSGAQTVVTTTVSGVTEIAEVSF
ncbi:unnamed protein product [Ectocarpus sp. CCAP 1310/34]|nr:unnamed protein product [Ectocarpus sp. CCAP 1310/34]